jgi:hypothetical protein
MLAACVSGWVGGWAGGWVGGWVGGHRQPCTTTPGPFHHTPLPFPSSPLPSLSSALPQFEGPLPSNLGGGNLVGLDLVGNKLSGPLEGANWKDLENLESLLLSNNQLTGERGWGRVVGVKCKGGGAGGRGEGFPAYPHNCTVWKYLTVHASSHDMHDDPPPSATRLLLLIPPSSFCCCCSCLLPWSPQAPSLLPWAPSPS